jgi:hypothetical protein
VPCACTWVEQHNSFSLGENVPISTGNLNAGLIALKDGKIMMVRVPTAASTAASTTPTRAGRAGGLRSRRGDRALVQFQFTPNLLALLCPDGDGRKGGQGEKGLERVEAVSSTPTTGLLFGIAANAALVPRPDPCGVASLAMSAPPIPSSQPYMVESFVAPRIPSSKEATAVGFQLVEVALRKAQPVGVDRHIVGAKNGR